MVAWRDAGAMNVFAMFERVDGGESLRPSSSQRDVYKRADSSREERSLVRSGSRLWISLKDVLSGWVRRPCNVALA